MASDRQDDEHMPKRVRTHHIKERDMHPFKDARALWEVCRVENEPDYVE